MTGRGDARSPSVLVVDDEATFTEILAELLEDEGYGVLRAYDGEQALAILQSEEPPDLVLSDVMMPKLTGPQLVAAARQVHPPERLPFVLLSAGPHPQLDMDQVWFLPKPLELERLLERVGSLLESRNMAA